MLFEVFVFFVFCYFWVLKMFLRIMFVFIFIFDVMFCLKICKYCFNFGDGFVDNGVIIVCSYLVVVIVMLIGVGGGL